MPTSIVPVMRSVQRPSGPSGPEPVLGAGQGARHERTQPDQAAQTADSGEHDAHGWRAETQAVINCGMVARQKTPAFGLSRSVVSPVTHPRHGGTAERPGPAADDSFADVADSGPRRARPHPSRRCAHPASRSWSPGTSVGAYQRPSFIPGTQPRQRQQSVRGSGGGEHRGRANAGGRAPEEDPSDDTDDGGQGRRCGVSMARDVARR